MKQLGTRSVTVRTRTAAQKLNYLRELIYDDPQVEPIYISGDSQRADGLTKILSGRALVDCQKGLSSSYPSSHDKEGQYEERIKKQAKKPAEKIIQAGTAMIGACIVHRQSGRESRSLDSGQEKSGDVSAVSTPSCLACQEGQDQEQEVRYRNMSIMMCNRSHMVHENRGGAKRGKAGWEGRPRRRMALAKLSDKRLHKQR